MVITSSQTGLGSLQRDVHKIVGAPWRGVLDTRIGNRFHLMATMEIGQRYQFTSTPNMRPFLEV